MKKIAIFVEGMTEQEFVVELVKSLVGNRKIEFSLGYQWKGQICIQSVASSLNPEFFVLVVDCRHDGQVKTQILERYTSLVANGYTSILGLRDVYPFQRNEIPQLRKGLDSGIPSNPIQPTIHLAEMEVEAWFLGEMTHFERINKNLTIPLIESNGFNISATPADQWHHPTKVLDDIYNLTGYRYLQSGRKIKKRVQRTLRALSLDEFYTNVREALPALDVFITDVEAALF